MVMCLEDARSIYSTSEVKLVFDDIWFIALARYLATVKDV